MVVEGFEGLPGQREQTKSSSKEKTRKLTSPGLASPGPNPEARPGVGASRQVPGGSNFFAHPVGPSFSRPTTCSKVRKWYVIWVAIVGWDPDIPIPGLKCHLAGVTSHHPETNQNLFENNSLICSC